MAGHNKWKQIKERKGVVDKKKSATFSKLLRPIAIAAKENPNPEFNARLRAAIERAREANVPNENIERAVSRAAEEKDLEELRIEAYGPEGVQIIVLAATDNRNRTIAETRTILQDRGAKMAEEGSVTWAFEAEASGEWKPKFPQAISEEAREKLAEIIEALESHDDITKVITSAKS